MSALLDKEKLIAAVTQEAKELLQGRGNLDHEDLEYLVTTAARLKDERLKGCIAELIGWGDDERARIETITAIGIECMKLCRASVLREAVQRVEMRYHIKAIQAEQTNPRT